MKSISDIFSMSYRSWISTCHFGTSDAFCTPAMREKYPRSGPGLILATMIFIAATVLILRTIVEKIPRP